MASKMARGIQETLGVIDDGTMTWLKEEKKLSFEDPLIIIRDETILHAQGDRKKAPLTPEEFKSMPEIIANHEEVYFDSGDKKDVPTLLYIGESQDDSINKIVIKLQQTVKNQIKNWFATAGKIKESDLKDPRYEKIPSKK
jgi:hypothetical protein